MKEKVLDALMLPIVAVFTVLMAVLIGALLLVLWAVTWLTEAGRTDT